MLPTIFQQPKRGTGVDMIGLGTCLPYQRGWDKDFAAWHGWGWMGMNQKST
jgi:hypothetical protein